jgi:hypothetical protein
LTVNGLNSIHEQASLGQEDGLDQANKLFLADRRPMLAAVPFFHAMRIVVGLRSLMCRSIIVTLPSKNVLTAGLAIEAIESISLSASIFPPSILEDMSATDRGIDALSKLETVFFGGAPLATASGNKICQVTKLKPYSYLRSYHQHQMNGATSTGAPSPVLSWNMQRTVCMSSFSSRVKPSIKPSSTTSPTYRNGEPKISSGSTLPNLSSGYTAVDEMIPLF